LLSFSDIDLFATEVEKWKQCSSAQKEKEYALDRLFLQVKNLLHFRLHLITITDGQRNAPFHSDLYVLYT